MRNGQKRDFARDLRGAMTDAEHRLWYHLRGRRLLGAKFRRQFPIGPYIADFACPEARLIVEVDGGQHNDSRHDAIRDRFIHGHGFTVLRFWNNDVLADTDVVLAAICDALVARPSPGPLPQAGQGADNGFPR